ncbi:hypothetical protein [Photobacterium leiognathi]|uniref:hypothetical protein n=1 Tax=Photobacterium leiognathi TaxID=553611 RepID=UPI00298262B9|nr:hypothetical protein [Photobacterium leiognathi]
MVTLLVDDELELIDTLDKVNQRIKEIKEIRPDAEFVKQPAIACNSCGAFYCDEIDTAFCGCHDY